MTNPFCSAVVIYRFQCAACRIIRAVTFKTPKGGDLPKPPTLPDGWSVVNGDLICSQHEIRVAKKERP